MGGEYVPENVIEVEVSRCDKNVATHPMWHFANWQLWGREEDYLAWRGLSGYLGKEEIIKEKLKMGGKSTYASNFLPNCSKNGKMTLEKLRHKNPNHDKEASIKGCLALHKVKNSEGKSEHAVRNGIRYGKKAAAVRKEQTRKPVVMTDISSGEEFDFPSIKDAARGLGLHHQNIRQCLKGQRLTVGGFSARWG
jgi:hypothetical protein